MTANSFDEGVMIGRLLGRISGEEVNIIPLSITSNGTYVKTEKVDGYNPIHVNVAASITSLNVTANGEYVAPEGFDGFNPVTVDVPDKYDEGYADGYKDGGDDTRDKISGDPEDPTHKEIYEEGQSNGVYTPPEGTTLDDILEFTGGEANIIDKTANISIKTIYETNDDGTISSGMYAVTERYPNGALLWRWNRLGYKMKLRLDSVDSTTGDWVMSYWYPPYNSEDVRTTTGTTKALIGFGAGGNQLGVQNQPAL